MTLNKRVTFLIFPVLAASFLLVSASLYLLERKSVYSLAKSSIELETADIVSRFTQYGLVARSIMAVLLQSDSLANFLNTEDDQFKSLAINSRINDVFNVLGDTSHEHFSITFLRGDKKLEYYYENSLDPFAECGRYLMRWAEMLIETKTATASIYFKEEKTIAYCRVLDRLTLKPAVDFDSAQTIAIIVELSPTRALKTIEELQEKGNAIHFWSTNEQVPRSGDLDGRRTISGFGTIGISMNREQVDENLGRVFWQLIIVFLFLTAAAHLIINYLLNRHVIGPIHTLERQLGDLDFTTSQRIKVIHSNDEIGGLSISFAKLYEKLQETYRETKDLAERDSLTRLYNRRIFHLTFDKLIRRASFDTSMVALLYIDIDNFKYVNDHYGHTAGDNLLQSFALKLHELVRGSDVVVKRQKVDTLTARLAGDEFAVLLHSYTEEDVPGKVARRILSLCENGFDCDGEVFPVTLSIGIATFPQDAKTVETLVARADAAMYRSKKSGKNKVSFSST